MASLFKAVSTSAVDKPESSAPRSRILILSSRGVTFRHRHLLIDLVSMLPHSRKDAKLDSKKRLHELNEIADLHNCNGVLFLEARKRQDLYLWLALAPNGPCVKFHVHNLHTMSELNFSGNALKGSRPIVSFDKSFDSTPSLALIKELLLHTFSVPRGARKSKPFIDRVVSFSIADNKIWVRHYQIQITPTAAAKKGGGSDDDDDAKKKTRSKDETELIEIGPRFVLTPIVILEGSFGGPVVFENREFVSPNAVRRAVKERKAVRAGGRGDARVKRSIKKKEVAREQAIAKMAEREIDDVALFA